jgi:rubrerythrin
MARPFRSLTAREILAVAIGAEEEDSRVYDDFANALRERYPATSEVFVQMRDEEAEHRRRLIDLYRARFGEHIPLVRREDIKGFVRRKPPWMVMPRGVAAMRQQAAVMELETLRFYRKAAAESTDAEIRKLLGDLADAESRHEQKAGQLVEEKVPQSAAEEEASTERRLFVMQVVQPGLAGLMDGSVSTLAPLFAAAFATRSSHDALLVGLAASLGAGISMGFAEALSDDGALTGRGHPWVRGLVCGLMTTLGGIGHTLPYLIADFRLATGVAATVVAAELAAISWIRHRYMDTPLLAAAFQVVVGGVLVFLTGILIGSS